MKNSNSSGRMSKTNEEFKNSGSMTRFQNPFTLRQQANLKTDFSEDQDSQNDSQLNLTLGQHSPHNLSLKQFKKLPVEELDELM